MGFNPKKIGAIVFFLFAVLFLGLSILSGLGMGLGSTGSSCTEEQRRANPQACQSGGIGGFLGGFLGGTICSATCCAPIAFIFFIIGAFLWSGGKKDELRQIEIDSLKKGKEATGKRTEGF
jgi:hypothetical protein